MVYLNVQLFFLAVDNDQRREPEAREYDTMDVDGEPTMGRACGMFPTMFLF
jgi:hypothetical protein